MNTGIKSRDELIKEIAQALQENIDYFDSFNYMVLPLFSLVGHSSTLS